ncbi:GntR family transcriptional regulator [Saccharopolyspora gloriosae]|uniref:GntR family transcriptional regulator n=1 Tax=Saccharopolyspora gloriosae TaxID=455344 RepID=UPI001FB7C9EA|nr:GntR family transcriptional regulator [Saccharopolyspora gloriosae]
MPRPSETVYDALKSLIQTGQLAPGEHLVEDELCARHEVSRTPVRNALRKLSSEDLVTIKPHRGAFVASWTDDDAAEVMTLRSMLEPHAAALAAQRRTDDQLADLRGLCGHMETCEQDRPRDFRDELARLNHELHLTTLQAAASPRLYNITATLTRAPLMTGSFQFYGDDQLRRSLREHRDLVDAIAHRDAPAAHAVMEAHLRLAYRTMLTK